MKRLLPLLSVLVCTLGVSATAASTVDGLSAAPAAQREALSSRLGQYVSACRTKDWGTLYDLVSVKAKGDINKQQFILAMKAEHGTDFAQMPDLVVFTPVKSTEVSRGYDIYGCGEAKREGMKFKGVAVVRAVFEGDTWTFSGWRFTEFPNVPCSALRSADWETPSEQGFAEPMEEVQHFQTAGVRLHVDSQK